MTNISIGQLHAPQEAANNCVYISFQAIMSIVGLFANKYIDLNHEWNITWNYTARMYKKNKALMCPSVTAMDIHSQLLTRNMKSCLIEIFIIKL